MIMDLDKVVVKDAILVMVDIIPKHHSGHHYSQNKKNTPHYQKWNKSKTISEKGKNIQDKKTHKNKCYRCEWKSTDCILVLHQNI